VRWIEIALEQGPGGCDRREITLEHSDEYELREKNVYRTKCREGATGREWLKNSLLVE
jgi:hypothetical protein